MRLLRTLAIAMLGGASLFFAVAMAQHSEYTHREQSDLAFQQSIELDADNTFLECATYDQRAGQMRSSTTGSIGIVLTAARLLDGYRPGCGDIAQLGPELAALAQEYDQRVPSRWSPYRALTAWKVDYWNLMRTNAFENADRTAYVKCVWALNRDRRARGETTSASAPDEMAACYS